MPGLNFILKVLAIQAFVWAVSSQVPWETSNARVNDLVIALTPEEKLSLVAGSVNPGDQNVPGYVNPIPRLGIPVVQLSDGEA